MKFKPSRQLVFITGIIMGVLAAAAEAFFQVQPPEAYGICLIGHPRELTNWIADNLFGANWALSEAFLVFPTLLVVGVFVGSFMAAHRSKELKLRPGPVRNKYMAILFGFLVANLGLLWGACPIRTALLISYGNIMAVVAFVSIIVGVLLACIYIRWATKKESFQ